MGESQLTRKRLRRRKRKKMISREKKSRLNRERKVDRRKRKVVRVAVDLTGLVLKVKKGNMGKRNREKMRKEKNIRAEVALVLKLTQGVHLKMIEEERKRGEKKK